jgi:uncharacterized membrane protein (DUF2068 family)
MLWAPMQELFDNFPLLVALEMAFLGTLRVVGGIGLLRNKLWWLWITLVAVMTTLAGVAQYSPVAIIDSAACAIIAILALIGYFADSPLVTTVSRD